MNRASIGIIGGTGLYKMKDLTDVEEVKVDTPFGPPSDNFILGTLSGRRVAFLSRHGRGHRLSPTEINYRANIYGFKKLGVRQVLSVTAVGSLKLEHRPMDIVLPDQFLDRTRNRVSTFFGDGLVAHVAFGDPVCIDMVDTVRRGAEVAGCPVKIGGTYVCMEGPAFSTRAESNLYRSWGMDIIGMTNVQEAKLSREAELCYATMAMVTDYDCWHVEEEPVTVEMVVEYLGRNAESAQRILRDTIPLIDPERVCSCHRALAGAILTQRECIPAATMERLALLVGPYLSPPRDRATE